MGKSSRQRKADRKLIHQEHAALQESVARLDEGRLPNSVTTNSSVPETSAHMDNYRLIFEYYNSKISEIHLISDTIKTTKLITQLKEITNSTNKNIFTKNIIRDSINNSGSYAPLYKGCLETSRFWKQVSVVMEGYSFLLSTAHP